MGAGSTIEDRNFNSIEILRPDFGSPSAYCLRADLIGDGAGWLGVALEEDLRKARGGGKVV